MSSTEKISQKPNNQNLKAHKSTQVGETSSLLKAQKKVTKLKLVSKALLISSAASCILAACKEGNLVEPTVVSGTSLFSGEILSTLSDDATLVGRIMAGSKHGQKFLMQSSIFNSSKSKAPSNNHPSGSNQTTNSGSPLSDDFKLGEIEEIVKAVDEDGKLKEALEDLAFAVVPSKSVSSAQAKGSEADTRLGVEVIAKFKDNTAKSRLDSIVKALQQNGVAIKPLKFDGCDTSISFTQQVEIANPSQKLAAGVDLSGIGTAGLDTAGMGTAGSEADIPKELKSDLKSEFEISIGSQRGLLFAATDGSWVKEQCSKREISGQKKLPQLVQSKVSQELINAIPAASDSFSFILASPAALVKAATSFSKARSGSDQATQLSNNLPEAVLFTQEMPDSLISRVNLSVSKLPHELHAGLSGDINPLLNHISDNSIVSLSLSGDLLRAAANLPHNSISKGEPDKPETPPEHKSGKKGQSSQTNSPADQSNILKQLSPYLNNNRGISISITSIAAGKMFPGVALIINDPQADKLKERFKQDLPNLLGDTASMLPPFQTKSSGSINIDYSLTPFGVGLYLASKDELLIIATEEELLASLANRSGIGSHSAQSASSIVASLEPTFKKELQGLKNAAFFNLDFNRLAAAISSAENTASMFTGGKGLVSTEQLRTIKEMGKIAGRLNMANGILSFVQSNAYPPQTP